jgi:hypothetical protein
MNCRSKTVLYPSDSAVTHDLAMLHQFSGLVSLLRKCSGLGDQISFDYWAPWIFVINQYAAVIQFEGSIFLMVVLRRLVFQPECRFFDMVNMFFIPSGPTDSVKSVFEALNWRCNMCWSLWRNHFQQSFDAVLHCGTTISNIIFLCPTFSIEHWSDFNSSSSLEIIQWFVIQAEIVWASWTLLVVESAACCKPLPTHQLVPVGTLSLFATVETWVTFEFSFQKWLHGWKVTIIDQPHLSCFDKNCDWKMLCITAW